jgi:hypothetical protein
VYLWAKRVVSPWWSLVAAALVLLLPGFVLSGMVMSENAALPTFTFTVFAIALAVEEPKLWRQGLVVVTLVLAYGARAQGLVLLAILPTAVLLDVVLEVRAGVPRADVLRRARGFAPLAAVVALGFLGYIAHSGFSLGHALGGYGGFIRTHYEPLSVLLWTARHAGEAVLATGVASFCALLLLFFRALGGRLEGRTVTSVHRAPFVASHGGVSGNQFRAVRPVDAINEVNSIHSPSKRMSQMLNGSLSDKSIADTRNCPSLTSIVYSVWPQNLLLSGS